MKRLEFTVKIWESTMKCVNAPWPVSNENPGSLINSLGFPMNIWGFYSDDNIFPRSNFFLTNSFLTVCNIGQEFSKQVIINLAISVKPMGLTQLI